MKKTIMTSKTVWVNIIAITTAFIASEAGVEIPPETQVAILGVVNFILRVITKEPLKW